jgi:hypothetical protein
VVWEIIAMISSVYLAVPICKRSHFLDRIRVNKAILVLSEKTGRNIVGRRALIRFLSLEMGYKGRLTHTKKWFIFPNSFSLTLFTLPHLFFDPLYHHEVGVLLYFCIYWLC